MRGNKAYRALCAEEHGFAPMRGSTRQGYNDTVDRNVPSDFYNSLSISFPLAVRSIREINIEILTKRLDKSKGTTSWKFILQIRRIERRSRILKK